MTASSACDWVVRDAELTDIPAIVDVWWEFMLFHATVDSLFIPAPDGRDKFARHLKEQLASTKALLLVADSEMAIVGYCLGGVVERPPVLIDGAFGKISDLAVIGRRRRHGIGEALLRAAEEWFKERGIRRVELQLLTANDIASRFWAKMGYEAYLEKRFREV